MIKNIFRNEIYYEVYCNGKPTGMGSNSFADARNMMMDYAVIYGGKCELKELNGAEVK